MIELSSITHWRTKAPWGSDAQVEQDLILSRALIEIFQDDYLANELAFRGGTALQKLFYPEATRYSEDLDFVQIKPGGIGSILDGLRKKIDPWLGKPTRKLNEGRATLLYRYESSTPQKIKMRLKIEINTREHFTVMGLNKIFFGIINPWYTGHTHINTYYLEELLGTKLRALYQRKKGRDLFDLSIAIHHLKMDYQKIVDVFMYYMKAMDLKVSRAQFEENLAIKSLDLAFREDMIPLLSNSGNFKTEFEESLGLIQEKLVKLLPGDPWKNSL